MTAGSLNVLSLYWGFSIGGIAKYASLLGGAPDYQAISLNHACILSDDWHCDENTLSELGAKEIRIRNRRDLSWIDAVDKLLTEQSPDLLFTHGFNGHLVSMAMQKLRGHQLPAIMSYHGLYHPTGLPRRMVAPIYNGFTEYYSRHKAKHIVSVTDFSRDYLIEKKVPDEKISVIHNGIPDVTVSSASRDHIRSSWGVTDQDIVIGTTSRLDEVKGLRYLIDAVAELSPGLPNLRLVIVGTGNLESDLRSRAQALGDKVVFTGFRSDIAECVDAFDIYALPSLAEYHSIALLEAMRAAKPIVATSVGGNTESVEHEQHALVVPPADITSIAKAIARLVKDDALRADLAAAARTRYLAEFQESVMVRRTAEWLVSCADVDDSGFKVSRQSASNA